MSNVYIMSCYVLCCSGLQIRCVFVYLRIEVVEKRSTLTDTVVKNAFVLGDRHLSYANFFHNNRQIRIHQDYSCISCEFSLSAYFRKHVFLPLPARAASQSVRHPWPLPNFADTSRSTRWPLLDYCQLEYQPNVTCVQVSWLVVKYSTLVEHG